MSRSNLYVALKQILPDALVLIGKVVAHNTDDTSTIELPTGQASVGYAGGLAAGSRIRARGTTVPVGRNAFVRNGVVETQAPDGVPVEHVIGRVVTETPTPVTPPTGENRVVVGRFDSGSLANEGSLGGVFTATGDGATATISNAAKFGAGALRFKPWIKVFGDGTLPVQRSQSVTLQCYAQIGDMPAGNALELEALFGGGAAATLRLRRQSDGSLLARGAVVSTGSGWEYGPEVPAVATSPGQYLHMLVSADSTTVRFFVEGAKASTMTFGAGGRSELSNPTVWASLYSGNSQINVDDLLMTVGGPAVTSNFTPPGPI